MSLDDALSALADYLSLDVDELRAYAAEDTIGGFDFNPSKATFPGGSLWGVEGETIYALTRALQPVFALELGVWHGASTTHILSALKANDRGQLMSVDWWEGAGSLVPRELTDRWSIHYREAVKFIQSSTRLYNLCYEDCIHSAEEVYAIVTALKPKLPPNALVIHHDSEHGDDGVNIKRGLAEAGIKDYLSLLIEPSDCGLLFWLNR